MEIMQINNVTQSPNFGRLVITKEAHPALKRCPTKLLEKLNEVGADLRSSTEYIDIEVGKDLSCKLKGIKDAYFGVFESKVFKNIHKGLTDDLLEMDYYTVSRNPVYENGDEVVFNVVSSKDFSGIENAEHIDELVSIAKELDNAAIQHEKRSLTERVDRKNAQVLRNRLLDEYYV